MYSLPLILTHVRGVLHACMYLDRSSGMGNDIAGSMIYLPSIHLRKKCATTTNIVLFRDTDTDTGTNTKTSIITKTHSFDFFC